MHPEPAGRITPGFRMPSGSKQFFTSRKSPVISRPVDPLHQPGAEPPVAVLARGRAAAAQPRRRSPPRAATRPHRSSPGASCREAGSRARGRRRHGQRGRSGRSRRAAASRSRCRYSARHFTGTQPSSTTCIDRCVSRQPGEDRTRRVPQCPDRRLVLRRARGRTARAPADARRAHAPREGGLERRRRHPPRTRAAAPHRRRARATSAPVGPAPHHVEEAAVEQLAHRGARRRRAPRSRSAIRSSAGISTCSAERNAGIGSRRHVTSVTTPSVPSAPMKRSSRSPDSSQASSA